MADGTGIQWCDATWNPIRGCSRVSEGCRNCYAESVAARFSGPGQPYEGLARRRSNGEPAWTGVVRVIEEHLDDPLRWRRPRRVFVNSMSDLFHEDLDVEWIAYVFAVMALARQHTFQVLTKRPARMRALMTSDEFRDVFAIHVSHLAIEYSDPLHRRRDDLRATAPDVAGDDWPLPNVWLGVSVENQAAADERIPELVATPAAVRFLSCEPLLGPLDLSHYLLARRFEGRHACSGVNWVIAGGESGPQARPCDLRWLASIVAECKAADVACFVKQLGAVPMEPEADWRGRARTKLLNARNAARVPDGFVPLLQRDSHGGDPNEWPEELRVREFPAAAGAIA